MQTASSRASAHATSGVDKSDEIETVDQRSTAVRYVRNRRDVYRDVQVRESTMLVIPWGPRVDVIFNPREQPGIAGGTVHLYARTPGGSVEIARATIPTPPAPVALSASMACDHYVVTAVLGSAPPASSTEVESYIYACSYAERQ